MSDTTRYGIHLDPDIVRDYIIDERDGGSLDDDDAAQLLALDNATINTRILDVVDDNLLNEIDNAIGAVIRLCIENDINLPKQKNGMTLMSDTTPHNFDSHALSHQIAAALVEQHGTDSHITYRAGRAETRPGVTVHTGERTWCHIVDASGQLIRWNLIIDTGTETFGTYIVDIANGELNLAYITVDDAAAALADVLTTIKYNAAQ